jgi:phosphoribosylformimino-5-aminoimidazole carboxamide ribonucleotide (ProFAR) isomerase
MRLFLIILTFLSISLVAQQSEDVRVLEGDSYRLKGKLIRVLGTYDNKAYSLMDLEGDFEIHSFDQNLNLIQRFPLDMELKGKDLRLQAVILSGKEILVFSSFKNRKHERFYYILQRYSAVDFSVVKEPEVLSYSNYTNNKSYPETFVRQSDNGDYFSFLYRLISKDGVGDSLNVILMRKGEGLLNQFSLLLGEQKSDPDLWDMKMSDKGTLFLVGGNSLYRRKLGLNQKHSLVNIYACNAKQLHSYEFDFQQRKIYDAALELNADTLMCAFVTSAKRGGTLSILNIGMTERLKMQWQNTFRIDVDSMLKTEDFDNTPLSMKHKSRHNEQLAYRIKTYRAHGKNQLDLTIERQYAYATSDHPDAIDYYSSSFKYTHMIAFRLGRHADLISTHLIPKCQFGSSNYYFSFATLSSDSSMYLVYNDDLKNIGPQGRIKTCFNGGRTSVGMIVKIDIDTQKVQRTAIIGARNVGWQMVTDRSYYDEVTSTLYVYLKKRNNGKLIRISLPE